MRDWPGARVGALLVAVTVAVVLVHATSQAQTTVKAPSPWRTAWGHPDLTGVWTTDAEIIVPLERPAVFGERSVLNGEELARREADIKRRARDDKEDRRPGASLSTPAHWFEVGNADIVSPRTSLIVDPPNGRMPSLTAEAAKRVVDPRLETGLFGEIALPPVDGPEDTGLAARCITRGIPETWIPSIYNNGFQIVQTPEYVAILYERYHEFRVIPLEARPHVGRPIRQWIGDSRGRWEGTTLVVDVTNFSDKARFKGSGENLHVVERVTRVDANTVNIAVTVEDKTRWTRPWRFAVNGRRDPHYRMFEMACHEGNLTMSNMLSDARILEKRAASGTATVR